MALGQRLQKQRVLDGDGRVEVGAELVAGEVELPAQLEVDLDGLAVGNIGGGAVGLVVVGLGDGAAPVHDEVPLRLVRGARRAQVDVAHASRLELEAHLGKVRLLEQQLHVPQLLDEYGIGAVVHVDEPVHGLELCHGLGMDVARLVEHELVAHVA